MNVRIAPIDDWGTLQVETAADGESYTALASRKAREVKLTNNTGTAIDVRRAGSSDSPFELVDGDTQIFRVVGSTGEIEVKRSDDSTSQVTLSAHFWR